MQHHWPALTTVPENPLDQLSRQQLEKDGAGSDGLGPTAKDFSSIQNFSTHGTLGSLDSITQFKLHNMDD